YTNGNWQSLAVEISNIEDSQIASDAAIARSKLANGAPNHVLINDGSGVRSSEPTLSKSRGGTGADNSLVTFPTSGTIVTRDAAETLENKTLDEPVIENGIVREEQGSDPSTPAAGHKTLFASTDGKLYTIDSDGKKKEVGSGAGGGGINFLLDPNFEDPALAAWNPNSDLDYEIDEDEALGPNVTAVCVDWD